MLSKKQSQLRLTLAVTLSAIVVGLFFVLSYDIQKIDYATGRIKTKHFLFGAQYRTTYSELWITSLINNQYPENWHLIGYTNGIFVPQINTTGGKISYQIRTLGDYLEIAQANQESRVLVAQFIVAQLNLPGKDDRDIFVIADRSFDCFLDELPFPEDPTDELTTEEVRETIRLCTTPAEPSIISP